MVLGSRLVPLHLHYGWKWICHLPRLQKRQLRTKTNTFIVSLAVADFCVGMIAAPSRFLCQMENECFSDKKARFLVISMWLFFTYASGTNLVLLVLERYIAVVKPLKYLTFMKRRRVIKMVFYLLGNSFCFFFHSIVASD